MVAPRTRARAEIFDMLKNDNKARNLCVCVCVGSTPTIGTNIVFIHIQPHLNFRVMINVNFQPIAGNCAPVKVASETETKHASELASGVINALQSISVLNPDEVELLTFVKSVNPELTHKFAGCGDADKASKMFTHRAVIGEKIVYSINTAPTCLEDVLMNLASTRTLFRAVRVETAKRDKASENLTFPAYVAAKKLPDSVLAITGVRDGLLAEWFNVLRSMQVSEGAIRDLCKKSDVAYIAPETETETETETSAKRTRNTKRAK